MDSSTCNQCLSEYIEKINVAMNSYYTNYILFSSIFIRHLHDLFIYLLITYTYGYSLFLGFKIYEYPSHDVL